MEHNAIKGFHLRIDETGKEIVLTSKLYTWYMQRTFRESLDEPVKPGDVVLVKGRRNKNGKKYTKSRVLVMETFHFDGDTKHSPVLKVLEKYVPKNS